MPRLRRNSCSARCRAGLTHFRQQVGNLAFAACAHCQSQRDRNQNRPDFPHASDSSRDAVKANSFRCGEPPLPHPPPQAGEGNRFALPRLRGRVGWGPAETRRSTRGEYDSRRAHGTAVFDAHQPLAHRVFPDRHARTGAPPSICPPQYAQVRKSSDKPTRYGTTCLLRCAPIRYNPGSDTRKGTRKRKEPGMPRRVNLLDARKVISLIKGDPRINPDTGKPIRRYHDGAGLYLKTSPAGGWSWTYLYRFDNKPNQEIGLGSARDVSLADARELAAEARAKVAKGIDPRSKKVIEKVITFGYCVDEAMKTRSWRNAKSPHQWRMTLKGYCASIKDVPIARISTEHMLQVLQPLWQTRQVTAMRLRSRLEFVIDWAIVMKHRTEANPARWRNHLAMLLPKPVPSGNHHEAMDYRKVPGFVERLQQENRMSALAMEFLVLTACRLAEVLN